ncbi:MAG: UPF0280 family protein [Rhizobiaceae bacterium]
MSGFCEQPVAALMADGRRLSLRHGPIDLIVAADGADAEVQRAYDQAIAGFRTVLADLVSELDLLRAPVTVAGPVPLGVVARRMHAAAMAHLPRFVTPMAAVAGAVADHVLGALVGGRRLTRASVNNGGDIALWLAGDARYEVGICADPTTGAMAGTVTLGADDGVYGIATSGWRGRSHSLGIADAVTVLARDAATADAAATMIANEVQLEDSAAVTRVPACELAPDSDLGPQLVTTDVGRLSDDEVAAALDRGTAEARRLVAAGVVAAVFLGLRGEARIEGMAGYAALQAQTHPRSKHMLEFADA